MSELLRGGSRGAADVLALAKAAGIAEKTLRRAADDLGIVRFKQPNARNGPWLWRLPDGTPASAAVDEDAPPKVATPEDAPVAIFGSTHWSGKVATAGETGHLPPSEGATEGGHLAGFGGGHLLAGALRSPDGLVPPDLAETARRIAALTPAERTTYRTELAQAPPDDPNLAHDRAAFGIAEAALAGRPVPGWAP